ncbi:MAG TPA: cupin domain-containing protein [Paenibacillus sp.]|nr:cupin domain-containing protein [Paenibacillus sp.]
MFANIVKSGHGRTIQLGPTTMAVKEDGSFTRQSICILEVSVSPKTQLPPQHIHRACEELFYILEGEIEFVVGQDVVTAEAGDLVTVPIGTPHTYRNSTDVPSKILILHTDPEMVNFFMETESMIKSGVPAPQAIGTLLPKYKTDVVTSA